MKCRALKLNVRLIYLQQDGAINIYMREHAMLARVYILLFVGVVVVVDALLNYCEFRHGCKSGHIKLSRVNSRRIKIRVDLRRVNIRVICVASH
jgi:hypothetical protein